MDLFGKRKRGRSCNRTSVKPVEQALIVKDSFVHTQEWAGEKCRAKPQFVRTAMVENGGSIASFENARSIVFERVFYDRFDERSADHWVRNLYKQILQRHQCRKHNRCAQQWRSSVVPRGPLRRRDFSSERTLRRSDERHRGFPPIRCSEGGSQDGWKGGIRSIIVQGRERP